MHKPSQDIGWVYPDVIQSGPIGFSKPPEQNPGSTLAEGVSHTQFRFFSRCLSLAGWAICLQVIGCHFFEPCLGYRVLAEHFFLVRSGNTSQS